MSSLRRTLALARPLTKTMRSPALAKQIDRRTLLRFDEIVLEADHPHRIVRRQICAGPIARNDSSRHRHLNHPATAPARREKHPCQISVWVHGGATDVGDPSGRFGIGQLDEPRGDVAGVDGLEPHPTQGPQHGREALDREDRFDQLVELGARSTVWPMPEASSARSTRNLVL